MAGFYIFQVATINGTGSITVNGEVISSLGFGGFKSIEAGTTVNVSIALDSGFVSFSTISSNVPGSPFTSSPFAFIMPERDCRLIFDISGEYAPIDGYGLKYEWDWVTVTRKPRRLEIYEDGYGALPTEKKIQNLDYIIGNLGDEPINTTLVGSKIRFDLIAENTDFQEFLTGNNRKFLAKYYHDSILVFEGFVNTDRLVMPERSGFYPMTLEALDGTRSFESIRFIPERRVTQLTGALGYLLGALNQTYVTPKPVNICADIYEIRMDSNECVYGQFFMPQNAIFTDGEEAKFFDGTKIINETLYLNEVIERLCTVFMARVFLYMNEWYIIRLSEHEKASQRFFRYNADGTFDDIIYASNPFPLSCTLVEGTAESLEYEAEFELGGQEGGSIKFGNAERTARLIYNEFTAVLKLGVLDRSTAGGIFETKFVLADFFRNSIVSPYAGIYQLRNWDYVRCIPVKDPIFAPVNGVQYISDGDGECVQIWGTSSSAGLSDPNLSWIELSRTSTGSGIFITQELVNKLTIDLEYKVVRRNDNYPVIPINHKIAMSVIIGDRYLYRDTETTFDWTLTPSLITFDVTNGNIWNQIQIKDIIVPVDGECMVRLAELICSGGTPNGASVRYRNFRLNIEQNEALVTSEISSKAITVQDYNRVFPDYITHIGDAMTNNSTSAITLYPGNEVTELWSRDGVEQFELLDILVQELANFKGRKNLRIIGTTFGGYPDFRLGIGYDSERWVCTYINYNDYKDRAEIELFLVDETE